MKATYSPGNAFSTWGNPARVMNEAAFPTVSSNTAVRVRLTPRELDVLALLAEGLSNKLICRRLNISAGTVKIHVSRILAELGVTSRLQAVVVAQRMALLPPTPTTPEVAGYGPRRPPLQHDSSGSAERQLGAG